MNLSASLIKSIDNCQLQLWYNKVCLIPEKAHWKTKVGSIVHSILECLAHPKRRKAVEKFIDGNELDIACLRLIRVLREKYEIAEEISEDVEQMVLKALRYDFFFKGSESELEPEFRFKLDTFKMPVKGFIDRLAFYKKENYYLIRDFKTQAKPFSSKELENNIQAQLYQYVIKKLFNKPSRVEFIMLRQKEDSKNFIQKVNYLGDSELNGFELYLIETIKFFSKFNFKQAVQNNATMDSSKSWLCRFCTYKDAFNYYGLYDENNKLIRTSFKNDLKPKENQSVIQLRHEGCAAHQSQSNEI